MGAGFSVSHSLCSKLVGASLSIGYSFNDALRKKLIELFETSEATNPPGECCLFPIRWFNMLLMMKFLAQFRQLVLWFFLRRAKAALNWWGENQNVCRSFYSTCSKRKNKTKTIRRLIIFSREAHPTWFWSISTALASYWEIWQTATNLFIICIILHSPSAQRSGSHFFRRECRWFWLWSACVRWKHFGPDKKKINNAGWIWIQIMASAQYLGSTKILYPFLIEHFLR